VIGTDVTAIDGLNILAMNTFMYLSEDVNAP
jgi:hypothetical protein